MSVSLCGFVAKLFIQLRISVCTSVTIQKVGTTGNSDVMWSWDNLWVGCKKKSHVTSSKLDNILNLETVKFILPHKVPWYISMNTTGFRVPVRSYSKYIPGHLSSFGLKTRENFLAISVQINVVDNFNLELVDVSDTINRHDNAWFHDRSPIDWSHWFYTFWYLLGHWVL